MVARRGWRSDLAVSLVVALVVLGPMLLHRGYVLRGDMVFVPDQPWKAAWLGLDGRVPRFVPGDAFVWLLGTVVPGDLVQRLVLLVALVVGGCGAGRLVRRWAGLPRASAVVLFLWNPWVHERLGIGQWPVVVGYLLLPWVAMAAERVRAGERGGWPRLVAWLGISAVFSPASGLVAVLTAACVQVVRPHAPRILGTLGLGLLVNLPWVVPPLLGTLRAAPGQFAAFAPTGESGLGVVASVLSLGGIWKTSVVPGERSSEVVVALSLLISLVAVVGSRRAARRDRELVLGLGLAGLLTVLLVLLTSVPVVADALDRWSGDVAALGLFRDSHRYLGPAAVALLPGLAAATDWVWEQAVPGREGLRAVALLLVLAPVLSLPSLAWGLGGEWRPVDYPAEWHTVRDRLPPGPTVVLPWRGGYRGYAWNDRRAVLDPAPRFFPGEVLIDDRLVVGSRTLDSEDRLLRAVRGALDSSEPAAGLRRLGVRSVLVEKGNGGPGAVLDGSTTLHDGDGLQLLDLGATTPADLPGGLRPGARATIVAIDVAVLVAWSVATGLALLTGMRGRHRRTCTLPRSMDDRRGSP